MADPTLTARAALEQVATAGRHGRADREAGVSVMEHRSVGALVLLAHKGQGEALRDHLGRLGFAFPAGQGHTSAEGLDYVWVAPNQWLAMGRHADLDRLARAATAMRNACTLVAADDARAHLSLTGPKARDTLAKMLPIDLHPRSFGAGSAAVTVAAGMSVIIWQVDDAPTYRLAVARSVARSFWDWLVESAAEYGLRVEDEPSR